MGTPFSDIYDCFFGKVTDDMYMELDQNDTYEIVRPLLLSAIQNFEFPRISLEYEEDSFLYELEQEEINILATYMIVEWVGIQLATV